MPKRPTRGTQTARRGLIVGGAVIALTLTACGLFEIRDPVQPAEIERPECLVETASSHEIVLVNYTVAMICGEDGLSTYEEVLGENYAFELDPLDAGDFGGRDTLTRAEDIQAHETIVNSVADSLYFEFSLVQPIVEDLKAIYEDMPYLVEAISFQGDTVEVLATYSGTVDLTVVEAGDGSWVLQRWKDQGDEINPSLGAFRATYALE